MLDERGVAVDHTTVYRWVQHYAPEMEKRLRWFWPHPSQFSSWHLDETYGKDNGRWAYLYRAVDSSGPTLDFYFYFSPRRTTQAAFRFVRKRFTSIKYLQTHRITHYDKTPTYGRAQPLLKQADVRLISSTVSTNTRIM